MNHEDALISQLVLNEQQIGSAIAKRSATAIEELFAEDFVGTTPDGTVLTKRDVVGTLFSPAYDIDEFENTDIQVRVFGDAAVVVARGIVRGRYQGKDASGQFRYTRVWVRRDRRWYAVAAHSSMLPSGIPVTGGGGD
jgi:uncharacterized protein (TIGR02246 family)